MFKTLRAMLFEAMPRAEDLDLHEDTDLGYGGLGMTVQEYVAFRHSIEQRWGVRFGDDLWPHRLREIANWLATHERVQ